MEDRNRLPADADFGQQQVALVTIFLLRRQLHRRHPRATLVLPLAEAPGHAHDVRVSEILERLRRECAAHSPRAVHDDGSGLIDDARLDLRLEVSAGNVDRTGERALLEFVGLAHVEDVHRLLRETSLDLDGLHFGDLALRVGKQVAE